MFLSRNRVLTNSFYKVRKKSQSNWHPRIMITQILLHRIQNSKQAKNTEITERQTTSFPKKYVGCVENTHFHKSALNKIMATER